MYTSSPLSLFPPPSSLSRFRPFLPTSRRIAVPRPSSCFPGHAPEKPAVAAAPLAPPSTPGPFMNRFDLYSRAYKYLSARLSGRAPSPPPSLDAGETTPVQKGDRGEPRYARLCSFEKSARADISIPSIDDRNERWNDSSLRSRIFFLFARR